MGNIMSRRIAYWILAAAAVLTAAPAYADRECFEDSCRMPDVIEPPPPSAAQPASLPEQDQSAKAETSSAAATIAAPENGTARTPSPGGIYPQMTVDQAPRRPKAAPRRNVDIGPGRRYDAAPARATASVAIPAPVAAAPAEAPTRPRVRPMVVSAPTYGEERAPAGAAVIGVPATLYADDGVVAAYPDPSWKLCQIDERGTGAIRYYRCGPYSYHPYGAHGYRPYGSYRAYRSTPAYVIAPNAKIISIQTED
jgi:hypothetical protein